MLRDRNRPERTDGGRRLRAHALAFGLAAGPSVAVLGLLRFEAIWPPRPVWTVGPKAPPDGGWITGWSAAARSVAEIQAHALSDALWLAGALALLLLGVALFHLVLTLLADAAERKPRRALRAALGASPGQLRRERLRTGAALAGIAGATGLLAGWSGTAALRRTLPTGLLLREPTTALPGGPGLPAVALLLAACALVVAAAVLGREDRGLARRPGRHIGHLSGPRTGGGPGRRAGGGPGGPLGWTLAALQVASAVIVAAAALLLLGGAPSSTGGRTGAPVEGEHLVFRAELPAGTASGAAWTAVRRELLVRPGVVEVAVSSPGALLGLGTVDRVGALCPGCKGPARRGLTRYMAAGPGFFRVLGEPDLSVPESRRRVVVDRRFRWYLFENTDPVGSSVWLNGTPPLRGPGFRIQAVARGGEAVGIGAVGRPGLYLSALEHPPDVADVAVTLRTDEEPLRVGGLVSEAVETAAPGGTVELLGSLEVLAEERRAPVRWLAAVTSGLGLLCLLLGFRSVTVTLYARIRRRAAEIALRRAVGARRRDIARLILEDAGVLVGTGGAVGCSVAAALNRGLPAAVGGVEPLSAGAVAGLAAGLALSGIAAAFAAGRRAVQAAPARMGSTL